MTKRITVGRKALFFVIGVAFVALIITSSFAFSNEDEVETSLGQLPSMTMVYEVYGPRITVGDTIVQPFKEVHRLEYTSKTDWIATVIESPSIDRGRYGTGSNVGSYTRVNGNTITEYDAMDGSTEESTIADDTVFAPNMAFAFASGVDTLDPIDDPPGLTRSEVVTEARVCLSGECSENAGGVKYSIGGMNLVLFEGDSWAIPLEFGDGFSVRTAEIQASTP